MKNLILSAMIVLVSSCSTAEDELAEEGGFSFVIRVQERIDEAGTKIPISADEVEEAIRVIEQRLEGIGIAGMILTREGNEGISLKIPGVEAEEAARIAAILESSSLLGLHGVNPRSEEADANGITLAQRVLDGEEIVPGYRAHILRSKDADGNDHVAPILISRREALGSRDIVMAAPSQSRPDSVDITLGAMGAEKMIAFTKDMRPHFDRIAIVLDGEVFSAPVVMDTPLGKHFNITGLHEPGEAQSLAVSLMHPLENALTVEDLIRIPPAGK